MTAVAGGWSYPGGVVPYAPDYALYREVVVTTGQLLALNAAPQPLVPAPGAGFANVLLGALMFLDYNSAAYAVDAADNLAIKYTDASGVVVATVETNGFLTATSDQLRWVYPVVAAAVMPIADVAPAANAALVLQALSSEVLTGNSPLKVRTYYRVVPTFW